MKRVVVGSTSVHKIAAVKEALAQLGETDLEIIAHKADSRVNEQPNGLDETMLGAQNRAAHAIKIYPNDICIGIEGGIIPIDGGTVTMEMSAIAIYVPRGQKRWFYSLSPGIQLPQVAVKELLRRGTDKTTIGKVLIELYNEGDHADPHSLITNGLISRQTCMAIGIQMAMLQAMSSFPRN